MKNSFLKSPAYESDTKNVFYEDTNEAKMIELFNRFKMKIIIAFVVLLSIWFCLLPLTPIPEEECPLNADCGIYIHCDYGF